MWFLVLKRWLPVQLALILLAAIATDELIVGTSTMVLSETPFMLLTALLFLAVGTWVDSGRRLRAPQYLALAAVLAGLFFTRSIGIVFCAALVLYFLFSRRLKDAGVLLALIVPVIAAWGASHVPDRRGLLSAGYEQELTATAATSAARPAAANALPGIAGQIITAATFYASTGIPRALGFFTEGHSSGGGARSSKSGLAVRCYCRPLDGPRWPGAYYARASRAIPRASGDVLHAGIAGVAGVGGSLAAPNCSVLYVLLLKALQSVGSGCDETSGRACCAQACPVWPSGWLCYGTFFGTFRIRVRSSPTARSLLWAEPGWRRTPLPLASS